MRIVGFDPGASGAMALIVGDPEIRQIEVVDLPHLNDESTEVDARCVGDRLRQWLPDVIYLERMQPMPASKRGGSSSFKLADCYAQLKAVSRGLRWNPVLVTPQSWKRAYGLKGGEKEPSRLLALKLYPQMADMLRRKMDDGRAEAILIASYGLREQLKARGLRWWP